MHSQSKMILDYLMQGEEITPIEALNKFGCFRLGARIHELKKKGVPIISELVSSGNKKFSKYKIEYALENNQHVFFI